MLLVSSNWPSQLLAADVRRCRVRTIIAWNGRPGLSLLRTEFEDHCTLDERWTTDQESIYLNANDFRLRNKSTSRAVHDTSAWCRLVF